MTLASCRPHAVDMRFSLLSRTVHPELFQTYKSHELQRDNYTAQFRITSDGHYITWRSGPVFLTEVASAASQPLPSGNRLVALPLREGGRDVLESQGCQYSYDYQLEYVSPDIFRLIHKQLGSAVNHHELIQVFNSSGRLPIGGLSFIHVESRLRYLHIQAIHTFPDDCVLIKTQSCFRCPKG